MTPRTGWNYSLETEADRIINTLHHTANRFFPTNGFLVLPYLVPGNGQTVFLPDLKYDFKLLADCAKMAPLIPMPAPAVIQKRLQDNLLKQGWQAQNQLVLGLKTKWQSLAPRFWPLFNRFFPAIELAEVVIQPTQFGSLSSFDLQKKRLTIFIRLDMYLGHLAEAIISGALMHRLAAADYPWSEKEAFVDILLTQTSVKKLFPEYTPTLELTHRQETAPLKLASVAYLTKLGIKNQSVFKIENEQVMIKTQPVKNTFTATEKELLKTLIGQKNQVCSFDTLAEIIWPKETEEKFSCWAITKTVQRLRDKLRSLGISPAVIQAQRKQGYMLVD